MKRRIFILVLASLLTAGALLSQEQSTDKAKSDETVETESEAQAETQKEAESKPKASSQTTNAIPLQPLQVRSTVRAHGNIMLPQDI